MNKSWLTIVVVLVVVLAVVVMVSEADRRNRGNRRNRQRGARTGGNSTRSASGRRRPTSGRRRGGGSGGRNRRPPHSSCEEIYLPMCKGLVSYTHTKLPNSYNHTTQQEVYRVLEHRWAQMDHSCSRNMRLMLCSQYLPKCHRRNQQLLPCKRTCMAARRRCSRPLSQSLGLTWRDTFSCRTLPNRRCLRPVREKPCPHQHPACVPNSVIPVCANLTFTWGTLPNMFQQCDTEEINKEIEYFDELRATNCHQNLNFFLCGVYSPFCIRSERPFSFPCRELCDEIRTSCEPHYRRLYHNLPWPNKLQCHRYPSTTTEGFTCVMPNEGGNYDADNAGQ